MVFFKELEKMILLKLIWNHKRSRIAKATLRKKNKAGGIINLLRLQTILHSYNNQNFMVLAQKQTYRPVGQDRKHRKIHIPYGKLIFDRRVKNIQWGKDSLHSK